MTTDTRDRERVPLFEQFLGFYAVEFRVLGVGTSEFRVFRFSTVKHACAAVLVQEAALLSEYVQFTAKNIERTGVEQ